MKIEKARKHKDKRTVVVGEDSYNKVVGVITKTDASSLPVCVSGMYRVPGEDVHSGGSWYKTSDVRKATDEEIAEFFAWLRGDGAELRKDSFERLGGAPRGWEDAAPAPSAPTVQPYRVGDRVRLRFGSERYLAPTYFAPGAEVVIEAVYEASSGFSYGARGPVMDGGARSQVGLKHADIAGLVTSSNILDASASMDQRRAVGDSVIGVRVDADRVKNGLALIARIEKDDRASRPYRLAGGDTFYHADHTFPLTLDGFRAANAKQREYGVQPEDGDYVAIHRRTDYMFGVFGGGYVDNGTPGDRTKIKGDQDWSDRIVVITKKPRV